MRLVDQPQGGEFRCRMFCVWDTGRLEEHEPSADRATVFIRSGILLALGEPRGNVRMVTRYGVLELPMQQIASIVLDSDENGLHVDALTDSSTRRLVEADQLPLRLKLTPVVPATRAWRGALQQGAAGPGAYAAASSSPRIPPSWMGWRRSSSATMMFWSERCMAS